MKPSQVKRIEILQSHLSGESISSSPSNTSSSPYADQDKDLSPFVRDGFTPVKKELLQENLPVIGKIPEGLEGEYIKNGPNAFFMPKPKQPYHWFDGDGMLNAVVIKDGKVTFLNRWIQTERLKREKETENPIYEFGELQEGNMDPIISSEVKDENGNRLGRAQTSVLFHTQRLLALEENDFPYHIKLPMLETAGKFDFDGQLKHIFTAHPKVCPKTGDLFVFGYEMTPFAPHKVYYSIFGPEGKLKVNSHITIREPIFMHDFAISSKHMIFYDIPARFKFDLAYEKQPPWVHEANVPSRFGIIPRYSSNGDAEIKWFDSPACMIFHTANAYEEGDEVVLECPRADTYSMGFNGMTNPKVWLHLHQWRFNMKTGAVTEKNLTQVRADFPVINKYKVGEKNRYTWLTTYKPNDENVPFYDGWAKYDRISGTTTVIPFGPNTGGGECFFQPRGREADEDDGFLMVFVTDESKDASEFRIYDAKNPSVVPLATVKLPQRVSYGFHGIFVTQQELKKSL